MTSFDTSEFEERLKKENETNIIDSIGGALSNFAGDVLGLSDTFEFQNRGENNKTNTEIPDFLKTETQTTFKTTTEFIHEDEDESTTTTNK